MQGDLTTRGPKDELRINVREASELRQWCAKLSVGPEELRDAVREVGAHRDRVMAHLQRQRG